MPPKKKSKKKAASPSKPAPRKPAAKHKPAVKHKAAPKTARAKAPGRPAQRPAPMSEAHKFAIEAARSLHDDKCTEIAVLDVRGKNPMTDFLIVASGTSDRQMRAVMHHVQELGEKLGYTAVRSTSDDRATWLLVDFMNAILHLFETNTLPHYDLEMM